MNFVRYTPLPDGSDTTLLRAFQKPCAHPISLTASVAMGRVTASILKPGMVLSKPVFNDYRQRLADAGTILDGRIISLFQTWGISDVEVQGISEPSLQEIEAQMSTTLAYQQLSVMIDDRFYGAEPHTFIQELRRLVKLCALKDKEC